MISTRVSQASALVFAAAGILLLFAADVVVPALVPGFPSSAAWIGQALAAAWLGMAALNWLSRSVLLGGIYGRGVVFANSATYFVTAMVLLRALVDGASSPAVIVILAVAAAFAGVYAWLLYRGPAESDFQAYRASTTSHP